MTIEEFIKLLQDTDPSDKNRFNFYRTGYRFVDECEITTHNLRTYLTRLKSLNPKILLVGEAPGYRGCKLTGIPFTSEYQILNELFFQDGFKTYDSGNIDKEASASVIWSILKDKTEMPLMWNIYPFHPIANDGKNGKPKSVDIKLGKSILESLLSIFEIEDIYCIGKKANDALCKHPLYKGYIRHPSYGGKNECVSKLNEILK